jgi:stage II sporulation protein D (peptidoglycan lytic transglycosylase)
MRKLFLVGILLIITVFGQSVFGAEPDPHFVKIGLATDQNQIILNLTDATGILDLSSPEPLTVPIPSDQIVLMASGDQILVNFLPVSSGPLLIIPRSSLLTWNAHSYRGGLMIVAKNNQLTLINYLSLEDYLRGVVPREVPADWPMVALKAQAIAARTYAMASLGRHSANGFDLCPTDHCQVYGGVDSEHPSTDLAVAGTAGEVISYRGKVISALYHSSSGGFTLDAADVWNTSVPYLKPVVDWDQNSPYNQWTKYLNWEDLLGLVSHSYPSLGRLKLLLPLSYGQDGKLLKITLRGDLGEITLTGEQFRFLTGLPSSKVQIGVIYGPEPFINLWWAPNSPYPQAVMANNEVPGLVADVLVPPWDLPDPWSWLQDKVPLRIIMRGSGWGHGVGLSQWGAKGMAEAGYNERQILEHYYPGTAITDIYNINFDGSKK